MASTLNQMATHIGQSHSDSQGLELVSEALCVFNGCEFANILFNLAVRNGYMRSLFRSTQGVFESTTCLGTPRRAFMESLCSSQRSYH